MFKNKNMNYRSCITLLTVHVLKMWYRKWKLNKPELNSGLYRSSHPEMFLEKGVLKICSKFTGEHPFGMGGLL